MGRRPLSRRAILVFWFASGLALLLYSYVYIAYPFSGLLNDLLLNFVYLASVITPAWVASAVLRIYDPRDAPIRIWRFFSFGFWAWFLAELVWVGYNMIMGEVPPINLADPLYLAGYILLTFAVAGQYRITRYKGGVSERFIVFGIWFSILLLSILFFFLTTMIPSPNFTIQEYAGALLNVIYGVGDLSLAIAGMIMLALFRGGALGRPWWGFVILAAADVFYGWLNQTGAYAYETLSGDQLTLLSDLIYMLAYLVIADSFLRQFILLHVGPSDTAPTRPRRDPY